MYKIGLQYDYYPEKRNIIDKVSNATYIKVLNNNRLTSRVFKKIKRILKIKNKSVKPTTKQIYTLRSEYRKEIDFFHLFNSTLYGKNKWGVTFETITPYHEEILIGDFLRDEKVFFKNTDSVKRLNDEKCKFIIAISECTFNIQKSYLNHFPSLKENILSKMYILHPPQEVLMYNYKKPNLFNGINFMFLGREFLCKGGIEIIRVFNQLIKLYPNFTLTLVGDLDQSNGRCFLSEHERQELDVILRVNKDRIYHYKALTNDEVLKLMIKKIHVGLLPTHADTYGYSVLEFQAAGCPVITTNLRALPEINNSDCGWLIDVPKSSLGEPFSKTDPELQKMQSIIEEELLKIVTEILDDPSVVLPKALNSIKRIKENHSEEEYSKKLSAIYNQSI